MAAENSVLSSQE